jgi:hypothetical protein
MNIPIDFVKDINPNLIDPLSKSTVYTFSPGSHQTNNSNDLLFKFPYSENTYWTHFKYATSSQNTILESELSIVTDDGYKFIILQQHPRFPSMWYDTVWPLPSINASGGEAAIYLKIKPSTQNVDIIVHLSGFVDLLPSIEQYIISTATTVTNNPSIQIAISKKYNIIHKIVDYERNSPNTLVIKPILIRHQIIPPYA